MSTKIKDNYNFNKSRLDESLIRRSLIWRCSYVDNDLNSSICLKYSHHLVQFKVIRKYLDIKSG